MSRVPLINRYSVALHDTLATETHRTGKDTSTHYVVVKNTPFLINITSKDPSIANFRKTKITASLAYDCEPRREVTLIRSSPLEYVTHLSSNGELITIEARIHVLTSQNENSLFRVVIKLNDDELASEPLKVISKADNLKKTPKDKSAPNKKKRSADTAFGDTLQRIEQQQQEQKNLIDMLYQQNQQLMAQLQQQSSLVPSSPLRSSSSCSSPLRSVPSPSISLPSPQQPTSLSSPPSPSYDDATSASAPLTTELCLQECSTALRRFLNHYKNLSTEERPHKMRLLNAIVSSELDMRCTLENFTQDLVDVQHCSAHGSAVVQDVPLVFTPVDSIFDDGALQELPSISSPEHDGYWSSSSLSSSPSHLSSPPSPSSLDDDLQSFESQLFTELFSVETTTTTNCTFNFE